MQSSSQVERRGRFIGLPASIAGLLIFLIPVALAYRAFSQQPSGETIEGTVLDSAHHPVADAHVLLQRQGGAILRATTDSAGSFVFSAIEDGSYLMSAEKSGARGDLHLSLPLDGPKKHIDLVLDVTGSGSKPSGPAPGMPEMEFNDKPNFTISGVTDWTAVGGHGSDSILRTSEDLARETLTLKPGGAQTSAATSTGDTRKALASEDRLRLALEAATHSFDANHNLGEFYLHAARYQEAIPLLQAAYKIDPANSANERDLALSYQGAGDYSQAREHVQRLLAHRNTADLHRLAGELDEKLGDPLGAVRELEQAAHLEPSEKNYFEWGSDLLFHRALWQAQEVLTKGTELYPKSARMLTALGAALFAGALYDEAALRLCAASDLDPADPEPYLFMGKIAMAAPAPSACLERKLARFVQEQPDNSQANYLYAMAILKNKEASRNLQAEALLTKAVTLDPKCADAYLQLGILSSSEKNTQKAIELYAKAIHADPQLGEAHYRLGVAYDRMGEPEKAKQEFQIHDEIEKREAEKIERQRREVKQFLVVLQNRPPGSSAQ